MTAPPAPPSAPHTPASTALRPALGLLAGLGVTVLVVGFGVTVTTLAALRGEDPKSYVAPGWTYPTHLAISALGSLAGGFTTARVTAGRSLYTVLLLALILLMSVAGPLLRGQRGAPGHATWYPIALAVVAPLGVIAGGVLERRRERVRQATPSR
jgi:hypothetical protein